MLSLLFGICIIWFSIKLLIFGVKASWGILKFLCTVVLFPVILILMVVGGLSITSTWGNYSSFSVSFISKSLYITFK